MAGRRSLNKGKRAEREVIKLIQPVVNQVYEANGLEPPILERNLMQSHRGGYDLVGLDWLALEVKHQEQEQVNTWWAQCVRQAGTTKEPVLFYRKNNARWRIKMLGYLVAGSKRVKAPVVIELDAFLVYLKIRIEKELN